MTREQKRKISTVIRYTLLIAVGFIMVYPLIWMVGATFKTNSEIFTSAWFWPKNPVFDGYENAFKNYGGKINLILSFCQYANMLICQLAALYSAWRIGKLAYYQVGKLLL